MAIRSPAFIERELSRISAQLGYLEGAMELIALMPERATEITDIALNYIKTMRAAEVSKC